DRHPRPRPRHRPPRRGAHRPRRRPRDRPPRPALGARARAPVRHRRRGLQRRRGARRRRAPAPDDRAARPQALDQLRLRGPAPVPPADPGAPGRRGAGAHDVPRRPAGRRGGARRRAGLRRQGRRHHRADQRDPRRVPRRVGVRLPLGRRRRPLAQRPAGPRRPAHRPRARRAAPARPRHVQPDHRPRALHLRDDGEVPRRQPHAQARRHPPRRGRLRRLEDGAHL
ncbi:MAG: Two-component transcriptional response regulator, LuxR family, partial [uncultured Actinomycetospora sp.]